MKRLKLLAIVLAGILLFSALPVVAGESVSKYYTDVTQKWAVEGIDAARENGLMIGVSEDRFAPSGTFSTGQFAMVLWRLAGEPEAKDDQVFELHYPATNTTREYRISDFIQPKDTCYSIPATWAAENGYIRVAIGYDSPHYVPVGHSISRHDLISGLYFFAYGKGVDVTPTRRIDLEKDYPEWLEGDRSRHFLEENAGKGLAEANLIEPEGADSTSEWEIWNWAISTGIIEGYEDKTLRIENEVTRAQFATILQRFLTVYPELAPQK